MREVVSWKSRFTLLADDNDDLSGVFKMTLTQLAQQLASLEAGIALFDKAIIQALKNNDVCKRQQSIPGIGPMVSSAFFNEVGNGSAYCKGRDVSASLGLVPKQHSSGGKDVLLGIIKKGNCYLRCLLVQGSQSFVTSAKRKNDKLSQWINRLVETRGITERA
jgi:transposase